MTEDPAKAIATSTFFAGLSTPACRALAKVSRTETAAKRDILFLENSKGHLVYFLLKGSVQLHKTSEAGSEIVIRTVRLGELFAEVILFELGLRFPRLRGVWRQREGAQGLTQWVWRRRLGLDSHRRADSGGLAADVDRILSRGDWREVARRGSVSEGVLAAFEPTDRGVYAVD